MDLQIEVNKAVSAFILSKLDRKEVAAKLRGVANNCDKKCGNCLVPQTVTDRFREPVLIFLKSKINCLRSQ